MNILPLVSAFMILFALGTYTFFHNLQATSQKHYHFRSGQAIERKLANSLQSKLYTKQPGESCHPKKKKGEKDEKTAFRSPRDKLTICPERTLNLLPLIKEKNSSNLQSIAIEFLRKAYKDTTIYTPNLEHFILDTITEIVKEDSSITSFEKLLTKIPEKHRELFYKLTKGTQNYDLRTSQGYPALGDLLSLSPRKKPIFFSHASRSLLEATFGANIAAQIIQTEGKKWEPKHKHDPLSSEELSALLLKNRRNLSEFESLLDFKKRKEPARERVIDNPDTKLRVRIS